MLKHHLYHKECTMRACLCLIILTVWHSSSAFGADTFPKLTETVIDANIGKFCYAVTVADVDSD